MKYLIKFNENGERGITYAEGVHFVMQNGKPVGCDTEGFTLVDDAVYQKLIGNVDGKEYLYKDGKVVEKKAPEPSVEEVKAAKLAEIKDWTAAAITGGFVSAGVRYDSDIDTQITMQGICLAVDTPRFAEEYPQGCPVKGYDAGSTEKTVHWLDAAGVKTFCADLSAYIGACKQIGWELQNAVDEATTVDAVRAIKWPEGA